MWSVVTKSAYILRCTSGIGIKLGLTHEKKKINCRHIEFDYLAYSIDWSVKYTLVTIYSFPRNTGLQDTNTPVRTIHTGYVIK